MTTNLSTGEGIVLDVAGDALVVQTNIVATIGLWYHVVGWYDSSDGKLRLRINDATTYVSATGVPPSSLAQTSVAFFIGGIGSLAVNGVMDEVGFWKRVLTVAEITALYNSGSGLPFSSFTT
jgi:hypothetical protein